MSPLDPGEILAQFDATADDFTFPNLGHGYYYAIDARLRAYSDGVRWALIVEAVGYNPRAGNMLDVLHPFGNCLTTGTPGFENDDFLDRIDNADDVYDDDEAFTGAPIVVRGKPIEVSGMDGEPIWDACRRLVPDHRDLLLADETELRRRIPADLPQILRLEEWHQPRFPSPDEPPSGAEVYRQLAEVLAEANPDHYRPTQDPNTHWSNWPESGSL